MATYFTDFEEYTTGVQPSDWTKNGEQSRTYNVVDIGGSEGKVLRGTYGAVNSATTKLQWDDIPLASVDTESLLKMRFTESTPTDWKMYQRFTWNGNEINFNYSEPSGGSQLRIGTWDGSNSVAVQIENPATSFESARDAGSWIWMRFRTVGDDVQYRWWVDGNSEPGTWSLSGTQSVVASGGFGIGQFTNTTFEVSQVGVGTSGDSPPTSAGNVALLTPNADGTISGFENESSGTTNLYQSIDEATADGDTTFIRNTGAANASAFFGLENTPSDFDSIDTISLDIRLRKE